MPDFYPAHPDQHFGNRTWSQHGEDLMIVNLFKQLGIDKPTYIDLGAHHPSHISNTKLLSDRGSRGLNIEANPNLIDTFYRERYNDRNINVGVGLENGAAPFYMFDDYSGRNTFSLEEANKFCVESGRQIIKTIEVPVKTLNQIIIDHWSIEGEFPDFLNCDIEGLDYDILHNADFSIDPPAIICAETSIPDTAKMTDMMCKKGFYPYSRCGENILFVHEFYAIILDQYLNHMRYDK